MARMTDFSSSSGRPGEDRFEELYQAGMAWKDKVERRHQEALKLKWKREADETKECTFQPQLSATGKAVRRSGDVFNRLAASQKSSETTVSVDSLVRPRTSEVTAKCSKPMACGTHQRRSLSAGKPEVPGPRHAQHGVNPSLAQCTFQPTVSPAAQQLERSGNVFERLYQEGVRRQRHRTGTDADDQYDEEDEEDEEEEEEDEEEEDEEEEEEDEEEEDCEEVTEKSPNTSIKVSREAVTAVRSAVRSAKNSSPSLTGSRPRTFEPSSTKAVLSGPVARSPLVPEMIQTEPNGPARPSGAIAVGKQRSASPLAASAVPRSRSPSNAVARPAWGSNLGRQTTASAARSRSQPTRNVAEKTSGTQNVSGVASAKAAAIQRHDSAIAPSPWSTSEPDALIVAQLLSVPWT